MKYSVAFTHDDKPSIIEKQCFGMVLSYHPLGQLPFCDTPIEALDAAIDEGMEIICDGKRRMCLAVDDPLEIFGNEVLLLAQQIRATRAMIALKAAQKHWTTKQP